MGKLFYLPLEPYAERYTALMSCKGGWAEDHFNNLNVNFVRVAGQQLGNTINVGSVLDAFGRSYFALTQMASMVKMLQEGQVKDGDVIYVEDFWHPGIESLFYIRHLTGIDFKIGCFLHAQSVDDSDFSHDMREWMRPVEIGYGKGIDYIMVTSEILKGLCVEAGIGTNESIFNVGLPFNSRRLIEQCCDMGYTDEHMNKEDYVIFSSRFDDEKDPNFFLDVVEARPNIAFKLVNPRGHLTKNMQVMARVERLLNRKDNNLELVNTKNKLDYYKLLAKARVQFNCADQDWVSWTLLEAITFGCLPLYPIWKDFPVELRDNENYLYTKRDLGECVIKLDALMHKTFSGHELNHVVEKHNDSWSIYLEIMGLLPNGEI